MRELVRYRKSLVGERNRELNRLQKMLEGANIKISGTITDINGKSAITSCSTYFQENRLTLLNMTFSMKRKS
ncbi:MAG: hypothetical protein ACLUJR_14695 [Mediterraneibacter gnavus]